MKYDSIKILDIEETRDGNRLKAVFEVPGHHFNQSYPKRLTHTFPKKNSYFEKVDDGKRRYEKILEKTYLKDNIFDKEKEKVDKELDKIKDEAQGKKFGNK